MQRNVSWPHGARTSGAAASERRAASSEANHGTVDFVMDSETPTNRMSEIAKGGETAVIKSSVFENGEEFGRKTKRNWLAAFAREWKHTSPFMVYHIACIIRRRSEIREKGRRTEEVVNLLTRLISCVSKRDIP